MVPLKLVELLHFDYEEDGFHDESADTDYQTQQQTVSFRQQEDMFTHEVAADEGQEHKSNKAESKSHGHSELHFLFSLRSII